jgi:hypothetical protein
MLKKILILIIIFCHSSGNSQILISILLGNKINRDKVELGLDGGLSLSSFTNQKDAQYKGSLNLGMYLDFKIKKTNFIFFTGYIPKYTLGATKLNVFPSGSEIIDTVFNEGFIKRKLNYFALPFGIKYKFKNHIFIGLGAQIGYLFKVKDYYITKIKKNEDIEFHQKVTSKFNPIDWGLTFRLGYEFEKSNDLKIYINYYQGFINVYKTHSSLKRWNNVININLQIPLGKKSEK